MEISIRPAGLTKTSQEAATHHQDTVGAAVNPAREESRLFAAIRYVNQRMPTRMCSGTPIRVWKTCDLRAVRRTVRSGAGPAPPSGRDWRAASMSAPTRGVA